VFDRLSLFLNQRHDGIPGFGWIADDPGSGRTSHGRRIIGFSGKGSGEVQQLVILKFLTS